MVDKKNTWGGTRVPGPGKKLGRKKKLNKNMPVSVSLSKKNIEKLDSICTQGKMKRSQVIASMIERY